MVSVYAAGIDSRKAEFATKSNGEGNRSVKILSLFTGFSGNA